MTDQPRERHVTWSDPSATVDAGRTLSGRAFLEALQAGSIPGAPFAQLLGLGLDTVEEGRVVFSLPIGEYLYNPLGAVHGGIIATLLDSAMGCAVQTLQPVGRTYTTLELKVNYLRPTFASVGTLYAEGLVVHAGRQTAVVEARARDGAGKLYATASSTCLVFDVPKPGSREPGTAS